MSKNYKLVIGYDGTGYSGWEHKAGRDTIQGKLQDVLGRLNHAEVSVIGAGRTDAGVHAKGMVANVHLDVGLSPEQIRDYVNRYLPENITVYEVREAAQRFHARYNATGKTYSYALWDGSVKPVFERRYVWKIDGRLDLEAMRQAADYLLGSHDFCGFCKNPQKKKSTVRTIDRIVIERENEKVTIEVHGDGFLHHMVRIITGTLVEIGLGRMAPGQVKNILETGDRALAGPTAPAQGLCLMEIDYQ
nr:tRNA pseudouridine(38-40) synthase TruA [Lachnospiraceae bacterium]